MQRAAILLPGLLTCAGAAMLWQSLTTMDYVLEGRGAPGPGFMPFWVSFGVVVFGLILTIRAAVRPDGDAPNTEWPDVLGARRVSYLLVGFGIFLLAVNILGFVAASVLFLGCVSYFLGMTSLKVLIPTALGVGLMFHVLFNEVLRISLPEGMLGLGGERIFSWIF